MDPKTLLKRVPVYYMDGTVDRGEGRVPVDDKSTIQQDLKKLEW